jgi:hypothetical protein
VKWLLRRFSETFLWQDERLAGIEPDSWFLHRSMERDVESGERQVVRHLIGELVACYLQALQSRLPPRASLAIVPLSGYCARAHGPETSTWTRDEHVVSPAGVGTV